MVQQGSGISTDRCGNTSWLTSAKDFQSMLDFNSVHILINPFLFLSSQVTMTS